MRTVTSTADAVARRHRGCLEHQGGSSTLTTFWRGPLWVPGTGTERFTNENVADNNVAAGRCRHVATTNRWRPRDGAAVNLERSEAFARYPSEKTTATNTSGLQKVMSGDMMSTVTNKRRCEAVPADDVDIKEEPSNPKTPPLELKVYQAAGPVHASDVSASLQAHAFGSSKNKDIGTRKPTDCGQMFRAISVKNSWVFDAKKVLSKSRPSVLANVPSRMTFVDWHGQCFDSTTYVDWPRCLSSTQLPPNFLSLPSAQYEGCGWDGGREKIPRGSI